MAQMEVYAWSDLVLGSIIVVGPIARDSVLIQTLRSDLKSQNTFHSFLLLLFHFSLLLLLLPIPHLHLLFYTHSTTLAFILYTICLFYW